MISSLPLLADLTFEGAYGFASGEYTWRPGDTKARGEEKTGKVLLELRVWPWTLPDTPGRLQHIVREVFEELGGGVT